MMAELFSAEIRQFSLADQAANVVCECQKRDYDEGEKNSYHYKSPLYHPLLFGMVVAFLITKNRKEFATL